MPPLQGPPTPTTCREPLKLHSRMRLEDAGNRTQQDAVVGPGSQFAGPAPHRGSGARPGAPPQLAQHLGELKSNLHIEDSGDSVPIPEARVDLPHQLRFIKGMSTVSRGSG